MHDATIKIINVVYLFLTCVGPDSPSAFEVAPVFVLQLD